MVKIDELLIKAVKDLGLGNYKQARDNFKVVLSKNNKSADIWVLLGFSQMKLKEFENAYVSFDKALKIDDKHSFAWSGKAYLLCLAKNYEKALLYCDIALKFYPENIEAIEIKKNIEKTLSNEKINSLKSDIHSKNINEIDYKINKIKIEDILNSFNEMADFDDYYIENEEHSTFKSDRADLNMKEGLSTITDLNKFENIFAERRIKLLFENHLTVDEYKKILLKIKDVGRNNFKQIIKENNIDLNEITVFKRITLLTLAYTDIEYKTKGMELGTYAYNIIKIDDRLTEAEQISTIIHELTHHILSEIFTQSLMYIWNSDKTDAIEAVSYYCLLNNKLYQLMNEYCAHTVQGRFLPFGYQSYGSFNILLNKFDKKEKKRIKYYVKLGNSYAEDITLILEEFIPKKWRDEIKQQFKKDFNSKPNYDGILLETKKVLSVEDRVININKILSKGIFAIIRNDDINLVRKLKKEYEKSKL